MKQDVFFALFFSLFWIIKIWNKIINEIFLTMYVHCFGRYLAGTISARLRLLCSSFATMFHSFCFQFLTTIWLTRNARTIIERRLREGRECVVIQVKLTKKDIRARQKIGNVVVSSGCTEYVMMEKRRRLTAAIAGLRTISSLAACTPASNSLPSAGFVNFVNADYPAFPP